MASSAARAPSTHPRPLQTAGGRVAGAFGERLERWLEAERDQLALWLPVMLGAGIAAWFTLPGPDAWGAFALAALALGCAGAMLAEGGRLGRVLLLAGVALAAGTGLVWLRAERAAAPVLARPAAVALRGLVRDMDLLPARDLVRLRIEPRPGQGLPGAVRVNVAQKDLPRGLAPGAEVAMRAWLMPSPPPAIPGAYDFAQVAWFDGLGATGRALGTVRVVTPATTPGAGLRDRLSTHIQSQVGGSAGGIAAALVTGDRGAIAEEDAEAMRRSGLAHLLSISGLHVTAVVAAAMTLTLRLLALSPALALRFRLPIVAAGAGAAAALAYTWLSGAEVPTVRSCIAALLILAALALGRQAVTLRLVAAGALAVLLARPEALAGPSFQLSFAAVTAIVALHEHPRMRRWFGVREGRWPARVGRGLLSLLLTGIAVELALMPIALFHFHKAGLYGALANIVAIPLTTFVVMPAEALALLFDTMGLGTPFWWVAARALDLMLWIARSVAAAPGAVAALPAMPGGAFALMVAGGLWAALWRTRIRQWGLLPFAAGALWAGASPAPDLIVSGDGRHLAIRTADGGMALLRERAGNYVRDTIGEGAGVQGELGALADLPNAACSADLCSIGHEAGGRVWRILATRSGYLVPIEEMAAACRAADIVVSDRRLPQRCTPRWLKLDPRALARTGGLAIQLGTGSVRQVHGDADRHPWIRPPTIQPPRSPRPGRRVRFRSPADQ